MMILIAVLRIHFNLIRILDYQLTLEGWVLRAKTIFYQALVDILLRIQEAEMLRIQRFRIRILSTGYSYKFANLKNCRVPFPISLYRSGTKGRGVPSRPTQAIVGRGSPPTTQETTPPVSLVNVRLGVRGRGN